MALLHVKELLMKHRTVNYAKYPAFKLAPATAQALKDLDWASQPVTTELNRVQVLKDFVNYAGSRHWKIKNFVRRYGWLGQEISVLKNIRLPADLEQAVAEQVQTFFKTTTAPIVRLQVIFNGTVVPLHKDLTRETSFVIPVLNHSGSYTRFYDSATPQLDGLVDPGQCYQVDHVEIVTPTLINTKKIHSVEFANIYTQLHPRISVTAKWPELTFEELTAR